MLEGSYSIAMPVSVRYPSTRASSRQTAPTMKAGPEMRTMPAPTVKIGSRMRLNRKVVRLTDAATAIKGELMGFGGATAHLFVREGAKVVPTDIRDELAERARRPPSGASSTAATAAG
jgi:hypothetical protein